MNKITLYSLNACPDSRHGVQRQGWKVNVVYHPYTSETLDSHIEWILNLFHL